jgi:hypothetical protein
VTYQELGDISVNGYRVDIYYRVYYRVYYRIYYRVYYRVYVSVVYVRGLFLRIF